MKTFEEYELIEKEFEDLKKQDLPKDKKIILKVKKNGTLFEFLLFLRSSSKKVLVLGSGAFDRERIQPPIFNRHKWMDAIEESSILYNDPTLYLGEINIGWGYGSKERHYIKEIGDILKAIYQSNELKTSGVLYFGSSAGGFTSLMLASYMKGWAFVNNPQTDINKYFSVYVNNLKCAVYGDANIKLEKQRANVVEWFKYNNFVPRIHYAQNLASSHDMENHFLPFIEQIRHLNNECFNGKITTYLYSDKEKGHNPMDTRETMGIIRNIFKLIK